MSTSGIQLAGLSSGVDWTTLITQIIDADRTPETAMQAEQATNTSKINAFSSLNTQLTSLQSAMTALQDSSLFTSHGTSLSNSSLGWSATAGTGTPNGSYNVAVTQLASAASVQGANNVGRGLSTTSDVSGLTLGTLPTATAVTAGNFQVNGATVSVSLTDSMQDVFDKISAATSGAVTASYDPTSDKVTMQSSNGSPVVLGASNDTSNFLSVLKLSNNGGTSVSSAGDLGATQLNKPLSQAHLLAAIGNTDSSGNGTFQINGVAISFNVNSDSMQSVLSRINGLRRPVSPPRTTPRTTGSRSPIKPPATSVFSTSETSGGLLAAMGVSSASGATTISGTDALYSVNGGASTVSHSNTLTDPSGLSVTASSVGTQTVNVSSDTTAATTAINNFLSQYNALQNSLASDTKITVGANGTVTNAVFGSNHDVGQLSTNLRSLAFSAVPGLNGGTAERLQSIGIDFVSGTSTLTIKDPTALANALANNGADVANLFQNSTSGLATQLNTFITNTTGTNGLISSQTAALNARNTSITNSIAALERKLSAEQDSLTAEFTQMEDIEATTKSQAATLTGSFSNSSSSSS